MQDFKAALDKQFRYFSIMLAPQFANDTVFPIRIKNALNLRKLILDDTVTLQQIALAINSDPILATTILGLANSAMYGRRVTSVQEAIRVIGLSDLYFQVFAIIQQQLIVGIPPFYQKLLEQLWMYSTDIASIAYAYGKLTSNKHHANRLVLLGMMLHLHVMLIIYKSSKANLMVTQSVFTEYCQLIVSLGKRHQRDALKAYGVDDDLQQHLTTAYTPLQPNVPFTPDDLLSISTQSVSIPESVQLLVPKVYYYFKIDPKVQTEANKIVQILRTSAS